MPHCKITSNEFKSRQTSSNASGNNFRGKTPSLSAVSTISKATATQTSEGPSPKEACTFYSAKTGCSIGS
ncbi:hypothetical protein AAVH_13732 [Aphelenchoides avenae]|nr:hypothetical protein AAVH_13732 [Aphelenchus avenae]